MCWSFLALFLVLAVTVSFSLNVMLSKKAFYGSLLRKSLTKRNANYAVISSDIKRNSTNDKNILTSVHSQGGNAVMGGIPGAGCAPGLLCSPMATPVAAAPLPAFQMPQLVYARTLYEPVIHDHPPIHRIRELIEADKRRRRRPKYSSETSCEGSASDTSGPFISVDSDYY